jgi:hypothetical protein
MSWTRTSGCSTEDWVAQPVDQPLSLACDEVASDWQTVPCASRVTAGYSGVVCEAKVCEFLVCGPKLIGDPCMVCP